MGQIQSTINQMAMGITGAVVAKSVKDEAKFRKELEEKQALETQAKIAKEKEQRNHMFNTVAAKYGTNAANEMSEAEINDRYFELTDPKGYAKERQAQDDAFHEYINEEISKYVAAGMDEDRAATLVTTGVDIMDNPEAAMPNYNYDSAKGKQANNISLKQSITKKRLNKSFENRLANAKSRKIRQQSVGGKK